MIAVLILWTAGNGVQTFGSTLTFDTAAIVCDAYSLTTKTPASDD